MAIYVYIFEIYCTAVIMDRIAHITAVRFTRTEVLKYSYTYIKISCDTLHLI